jgi:transposase
VRSILRHRDSLVQMAATHVQHMQKALDQMNLQLHHVIADITGFTGLAIIEAILAGERDPHVLTALRDGRIKTSADTIGLEDRVDLRAIVEPVQKLRHFLR